MPTNTKRREGDDLAAQRAAADSLQQQIDAIVRGEKPVGARPASFRDFVNEKMAEDAAKVESDKKK